ncbi:hypothetical protein BJ944DRAFT_269782 [Cunninghamella echinulata]|nr:hypothetical protein BJ944DRAFT_269782 [Cunninghamella echinulata]
MLSASTINTTSSGFSLSPATSTPSSQYSSGSGMKPSRNPLSDLLEAETTYLKTLKIIDSQISPLWMKQTTQAAPDFTELIKQVGNLVYVNRQFSSKLSKFTNQNNPAGQELGKTLMQWVDDLEVPYANYSRSYIPNLNERKDILASPSIDRLLKDLSYSASYDITLESLFNAPIQQLKYYLGLYNRLLESADPSKPDFKLLTNATRRLETILSLSQKPLSSKSNVAMLPPPIRTQDDSMNNMMKKKKSLIRQEDFFSYYTETGEISPLSDDDQDDFEGYGASVKKHEDVDDELANIKPRTVKILPEVPGDSNKASVNGSSPTANNNNNNSSNKESSQIQMTYIQPATAKINKDVSSHNSDTGGIIGNKPVPSKQTSAESMSSSPSHVDTVRAALTPTSQRNLSPNPNESPRPISPRAVQVQQAVTPVAAMQAVPQKTNDYFSIPVTNNKPLPSSSSYKDLPSPSGSIPRTTSSPNNNNNNSRGTAQNIDPTSQSPSKPMNSQPPVLSRPFNPNQSHHNQGYPQQQQQQRPMYNQGGAPPQQQQHGYRPQHGHQPPPQHHQQGYGQSRPQMHPNGPPHPMQSRSTGTSNNPMYQQQQQRPPLPQQGGNYPPQQQPRPILQQPQHHQQPRTPPPTDEQQQNGVRQVLYSNNQCEVFHWKAQSWYAVEGQCTLQVRLTFSGRSCLAIQLQPSGQLYLNAWILPSMVIGQPSPTDISVSVTMAAQQENYLLHFRHPADASNLLAILQRMHHESMTNQPPPPPMKKQHSAARLARQDTAVELRDETPSVEEVPQTLKPVFQCKGKLFVQSETSKWNPMGSTSMRISQQLPSQKMHIQVEDGKNKLISSIVRSGNVEVLTSKRITFLLTNDQDKTSMVYMIQVKDEQTGNKIAEYLKTQNQANGW